MKGFLEIIKNFWQNAYSIFYHESTSCELCGKEVFDGKSFCEECFKEFPFLTDKICNHCGRKVPYAVNYCLSCKNKQTAIDQIRSVFDYEMPITLLIHRFKYRGRRYLSKIFAEFLANVYYKNYFNSDLIIYVPMFIKDQKKRGFNQSKLLAKELSKLINVEVVENVITKESKTKRQALLKRAERKKNLENSFKIRNAKLIKGKSVLLIDDVMTTGTTLERIAELLRKKGVKEIKALTVASVQINNENFNREG